jgi:methylated-DNA-[protein]-cysteine S-methyltransferase
MKTIEPLLERVAAAAVEEGLADAVYTVSDTPIGRLLLIQTPRGLCRIAFEEEDPDDALAEVAATVGPRIVRSSKALAPASETLEAYFAGATTEPRLPVDLSLVTAPFARKVLATLRRVSSGRVVTYSELASRAGRPRAYRAAGSAVARNPVPIVVPCHRVVPATGGVGNYGGGVRRKRYLLNLEGGFPITA